MEHIHLPPVLPAGVDLTLYVYQRTPARLDELERTDSESQLRRAVVAQPVDQAVDQAGRSGSICAPRVPFDRVTAGGMWAAIPSAWRHAGMQGMPPSFSLPGSPAPSPQTDVNDRPAACHWVPYDADRKRHWAGHGVHHSRMSSLGGRQTAGIADRGIQQQLSGGGPSSPSSVSFSSRTCLLLELDPALPGLGLF